MNDLAGRLNETPGHAIISVVNYTQRWAIPGRRQFV